MTERFLKPLTFWQTIVEVLACYGHIFKHIIGLVILAAIVQAIVSILMPENPTVGLAVSILGSVVAMFFYAWILYHADSVLMERPETTKDALKVAKKRFLPLVTLLAIYIVMVLILGLFAFGMQMLGSVLHLGYLFAFISLCIFVFFFTLIAFAMPSLVLDGEPAFKSIEYSARLVWGHWWRVFALFMIFVLPVLVLSLGVMLIPSRNIFALTAYEFIYHILTYPLMIALILVIYHDLKMRKQMSSFKHLDDQSHHQELQ